MVMPDMDGASAFRELRAVDPGAKVLLCSGFSQNGFAGIEQLVSSGAVGFVQKPFNRASIGASIKRALAS
jgi:two-component system chemotaxis response regulator CheY